MIKQIGMLALFWLTLAKGGAASRVDLLMIAADDALLQPIISQLENPQSENHGAWTIWTGFLGGKSVALTRSEGDPLNAAAATTLAIKFYPPRLIFLYGIARSHDPSLRPGDFVLSQRFAAFDGMVSPQSPLGTGSDPLTWRKLPHLLMTEGEKEVPTESFPADQNALAIAKKIMGETRRFKIDVLGSAAQINRESDRIAWLRAQWGTSTEDGESAYIAGCAALFHIPVFGVRVVDGTPADIATFASEFVKAWQ